MLYLTLPEEYPEAIDIVEKARKLYAAGLVGRKHTQTIIQNFDFKVIHAQGAYICGEETTCSTALKDSVQEVQASPPASKDSSTNPVVNNVETLAALPGY